MFNKEGTKLLVLSNDTSKRCSNHNTFTLTQLIKESTIGN
jgi:hypothetical protein